VRGLLTEDDEGSLPNGNHPVSAEPSATAAGGSNPTPRTLSSTHRIGSRYIQEIEPQALSEILTFGFWMQKTGYTVKTCIRSLKTLARRTRLLDPESVKSYLGTARGDWRTLPHLELRRYNLSCIALNQVSRAEIVCTELRGRRRQREGGLWQASGC